AGCGRTIRGSGAKAGAARKHLAIFPEEPMSDTTIPKVKAAFSPAGKMGQKYLAVGTTLAMRLWENEPPGQSKPATRRDYETIGFVLKGRAELHLEGQMV